jgi:hypothetical protein
VLAGNPLKGVPASIQKCQNLQFVDLRDTEIDSLPQEMSRLPKLADVGLSHRVLKPKLAAAYSSGTQKLMEYLARKDEKRGLKDALRKRFTFEVSLVSERCLTLFVCVCDTRHICTDLP